MVFQREQKMHGPREDDIAVEKAAQQHEKVGVEVVALYTDD